MSLETSLDLNIPDVVQRFDDIRRRQLPFATALSLTRTAAEAQSEIRRGLPSRFTIRNDFISRGVRMKKATKRSPSAVVEWSAPGGPRRAGFAKRLAIQETGGKKRPSRRYLALPRGVKRGKTGTIPRSKTPGRLLKRKNVFIRDVQGGAAIFQRVGRALPRLLYYLTPQTADVDARFEFRETAARTARRIYPREFGRALAQALASLRD